MQTRRTIVLTLLGITLAASFIMAMAFANAVERERLSETHAAMTEQALVIQSLLADARQASPGETWDALADRLGARAAVRVTLIAGDGRVLGDSAVGGDALQGLENHNERPEVSVARAGDTGFSVRVSTSVGTRLAYVAVPVRAGEVRVVRLARPVSAMSAEIVRAGIIALIFGLAAFALAIFALTQSERMHARRPDETRSEIERQRRIIESMQEGVLVLDAERRVVLVNRALREILLLSRQIIGRPWLEVLRNAELASLVARTVDEASPQAGEIVTEGLKPRRLLVQASPLGENAGGVVVVFVDVTEVRRLESLRRDFVANVSHELRTPVTAIRSAAETLRASALADPEMAIKFIDIVDRNAARLGDLVEDLLDLTRIESNEYKLALEPLPVHQVASDCLSLFRDRADKKRLQLVARVPDALPNVRADRRALEQVLTNLIDNAVKYCPDGKEIAIAAEENGDLIRLTVRDSGQGIDQRHLPRLFERFYRVDPGRARDTGGTGLGLSIAKHLVEAMGGTIGVESQLGVGTAFHLSLPKAS